MIMKLLTKSTIIKQKLPICIILLPLMLSSCADIPAVGFVRKALDEKSAKKETKPDLRGIQVVDLNQALLNTLKQSEKKPDFARAFGSDVSNDLKIGTGDVIEITIWEAPPATLFGSNEKGASFAPSRTLLPQQIVNQEGKINMPFAGQIHAAGRSLVEIEKEITTKLKGKANQPQIIAKLITNQTSNVTVVGEFASNTRMPLTPKGERLLDAIAAAGGVKQPINKMTVQVSRDNTVAQMPLEQVIRDPSQNINLRAGDVVTAIFQPNSFTAIGATGKNEEINFEAQGISLAQAIARSGGLNDNRADAQGVFIFRFEPKDKLAWPEQPVAETPEGLVPVIYRVNLKDPSTFFVAQSFQVNNKDTLYVSNAPITEIQKFLNVLFSAVFPITNVTNILRN